MHTHHRASVCLWLRRRRQRTHWATPLPVWSAAARRLQAVSAKRASKQARSHASQPPVQKIFKFLYIYIFFIYFTIPVYIFLYTL